MPINSVCYYKHPVSGKWIKGGEGEATLGALTHAEITAYNQTREVSGDARQFRFEQDAFPCVHCTEKFARESLKALEFEFDCKNAGAYAVECGYLPPGDARNFSAETSGTLRIIRGEARGLYSATVFFEPPEKPAAQSGQKKKR